MLFHKRRCLTLCALLLVLALATGALPVQAAASSSLLPQAGLEAEVLSMEEMADVEGEFLTLLVVRCVMSSACRSAVTTAVSYGWRALSAASTLYSIWSWF